MLHIQSLAPDGKRFTTSLWEMPADGSQAARRITFSDRGEGLSAFLPDGSIVFGSGRPDPTAKEDQPGGRLWLLPAAGGEARPLLALGADVEALATARESGRIVLTTGLHPGAATVAEDAERGKARRDAPTSAVLFTDYPIRFWDHDLGPRRPRLLCIDGVEADPVDIAPEAGGALVEAEIAVSPDGRAVASTWMQTDGAARVTTGLALIEGSALRLLAEDGEYGAPAFSPDGSRLIAVRSTGGTPELAEDRSLWLFDLSTGAGRDLTPGFDLWPVGGVWSPTGDAVYLTADEKGHRPVFRVDLAGGGVRRLTEWGAFTCLQAAPDGGCLYALRSSYAAPNEVVRIDLGGAVTALPTPGFPLEVPGRLEDVSARAADGTEIRGWLVLPQGASGDAPVPLVLWIHGGPLNSWCEWSWRWCPHLLAERGYAVLMPDPALSIGYGQGLIQRGWGLWGEPVMRDLMAITDAVLARPDIDASRTAAMGGSFGGYMSNWIAGHTDRFRAIVTHASLWSMDQFHATTDITTHWEAQFGDPYQSRASWDAASPNRSVASIRTPMLVIHGNLDYRVPISEALAMWTDLRRHGVPARFLYFPDENHWILKPGNATVWYQTVLAFLDEHLLGTGWVQPPLL